MFEHSAAEPASVRDLTHRAVLVVEDDYFIARELCGALRGCGAEVVGPAPDTEHGRQLMDGQRLDCAVLDVSLGAANVFPLASELRERGVRSIFAAGHPADLLPAPFQNSICLQKPIDIGALIRAVQASGRGPRNGAGCAHDSAAHSLRCANIPPARSAMSTEPCSDVPPQPAGTAAAAELEQHARNLLAVVRAIAAETLAHRGDEHALAAFFERLASLGRVQGLLTRVAAERVRLLDIVRGELDACALEHRARIEVHGPDVRLCRHQVQTVALALHELLTNAMKHGALQTPRGTLSVTWETWCGGNGRPRLALTWREHGVAMPASRPTRRGQGRDIIEHGLRFSLGAQTQLVFGTDGVWCRIELPL